MMKASVRTLVLLVIAAAIVGWAIRTALQPSNLLQMIGAMTLC